MKYIVLFVQVSTFLILTYVAAIYDKVWLVWLAMGIVFVLMIPLFYFTTDAYNFKATPECESCAQPLYLKNSIENGCQACYVCKRCHKRFRNYEEEGAPVLGLCDWCLDAVAEASRQP